MQEFVAVVHYERNARAGAAALRARAVREKSQYPPPLALAHGTRTTHYSQVLATPASSPTSPRSPRVSSLRSSLIQQLIRVTFDSNGRFDGLPPTVLVPHALHLDHQLDELVTDVPNRLLMRSSHLIVQPGKLIIPPLGHFSELTASPPQGEAIAGGEGSALFRRHLYLSSSKSGYSQLASV